MSAAYRELNVFDDVVVEVYEDGRLKTKDHSHRIKTNGQRDNRKGKFLQPSTDKDGYLKVVLTRRGLRKTFFVHRLVALAWVDNPEGKPTVNHKNGTKKDNSVSNLEWSTHSEQKRHAIELGLASANVSILATANKKRARKVRFEGILYESIREAARETGWSRTYIKSKGEFL